jgi:hypothetical protein
MMRFAGSAHPTSLLCGVREIAKGSLGICRHNLINVGLAEIQDFANLLDIKPFRYVEFIIYFGKGSYSIFEFC